MNGQEAEIIIKSIDVAICIGFVAGYIVASGIMAVIQIFVINRKYNKLITDIMNFPEKEGFKTFKAFVLFRLGLK